MDPMRKTLMSFDPDLHRLQWLGREEAAKLVPEV
jgi:hypothetical protein